MNDQPQYVICWKNLKTGKDGRGEHLLSEREAGAALLELNATIPDIQYWKEEAKPHVTVTINAKISRNHISA